MQGCVSPPPAPLPSPRPPCCLRPTKVAMNTPQFNALLGHVSSMINTCLVPVLQRIEARLSACEPVVSTPPSKARQEPVSMKESYYLQNGFYFSIRSRLLASKMTCAIILLDVRTTYYGPKYMWFLLNLIQACSLRPAGRIRCDAGAPPPSSKRRRSVRPAASQGSAKPWLPLRAPVPLRNLPVRATPPPQSRRKRGEKGPAGSLLVLCVVCVADILRGS